MVIVYSFIAFSMLLQHAEALVEFASSKLYDETDFAVPSMIIPTMGGRIYVSMPETSADIAKKIMVHDYVNDNMSLYDISTLKKGDEKGYLQVDDGIRQVKITNMNSGNATTPIAVWVYNYDNNSAKVYDAANLRIEPSSLGMITVISAEPFTLRSKTQGRMMLTSLLAGFDVIPSGRGNENMCTYVVEQLDQNASSDVQFSLQSPLLTLYFDGNDYRNSKTSVTADLGVEKVLDFSGTSFVASPGYIGCAYSPGQKTYRSSLYNSSTSLTYFSNSRSYDVALSSFVNSDAEHPVIVKDNTNNNEYRWSGTPENTDSQNITLKQTNNLEISWTRNEKDLEQSFLVRLIPSNEKVYNVMK
ncbi:hypothetical protein PENTCL1PPCAC_20874 [Pristionchus entomophagus]|uniref:Uncharacterized protein n=1 Tax=Pristionchus entomophagus TaxID=358040 RepID=A0AAV5TW21_9BILA|nr:hypothetical protein PENTCL1PPCAC_20874 [Pristionchus entomophagus]